MRRDLGILSLSIIGRVDSRRADGGYSLMPDLELMATPRLLLQPQDLSVEVLLATDMLGVSEGHQAHVVSHVSGVVHV